MISVSETFINFPLVTEIASLASLELAGFPIRIALAMVFGESIILLSTSGAEFSA